MDEKKRIESIAVGVTNPTDLFPKLCSKVLIEKYNDNFVLTFLYETGGTPYTIGRIIIDAMLKEHLIKLLEKEDSNE